MPLEGGGMKGAVMESRKYRGKGGFLRLEEGFECNPTRISYYPISCGGSR